MSSHPPLLLTKRLSAFLQTHQSDSLPTLLLATSTGKLLAHASPRPVSLLRIHATVAASLLAIHTSSSAAIPAALPGTNAAAPDEPHDDPAGQTARESPGTITVQLTGGTVVIRRLGCGLLLVCVGPPETGDEGDAAGTRRCVAELGRRLDDKLGSLRVPGGELHEVRV